MGACGGCGGRAGLALGFSLIACEPRPLHAYIRLQPRHGPRIHPPTPNLSRADYTSLRVQPCPLFYSNHKRDTLATSEAAPTTALPGPSISGPAINSSASAISLGVPLLSSSPPPPPSPASTSSPPPSTTPLSPTPSTPFTTASTKTRPILLVHPSAIPAHPPRRAPTPPLHPPPPLLRAPTSAPR